MAIRPPPVASLLVQLPAALRFLTRLPIPRFPGEPEDGPPDLDRLGPAFPLAGALIGLIGAVVYLATLAILPPFIAATLAFAALAAITGALHEDGFADTADGLGGSSRERRLAIMRDSRIGSFGAIALILAYTLRIGAVTSLTAEGPFAAAGALVAAAALARAATLFVIAALPSARPDGLAAQAGQPKSATLWMAGIATCAVTIICVVPAMGWVPFAGGIILAVLAAFGLARLAAAKFGGQTGDIAGAAALTVEIAFLLATLIFARQIG